MSYRSCLARLHSSPLADHQTKLFCNAGITGTFSTYGVLRCTPLYNEPLLQTPFPFYLAGVLTKKWLARPLLARATTSNPTLLTSKNSAFLTRPKYDPVCVCPTLPSDLPPRLLQTMSPFYLVGVLTKK
jgi:hypothetical protein